MFHWHPSMISLGSESLRGQITSELFFFFLFFEPFEQEKILAGKLASPFFGGEFSEKNPQQKGSNNKDDDFYCEDMGILWANFFLQQVRNSKISPS